MDSAARKILMLKRITKRLQRRSQDKDIKLQQIGEQVTALQSRIHVLVDRLRGGNSTSVPVPADLAACYSKALEYAVQFKRNDQSVISIWKNLQNETNPVSKLSGESVVDWRLIKLADGLYDAEFVREWKYGV